MQNSINSDLIRGHIDTIILSILYVNDRYGYEILGEIDDKSGGQYKIKQPTLYSCLKRLETQGFIYSYRGDETESGGGRRKYYALTEMGKELFRKNQLDWEYSRTVIDKLVSDKAYQFIPFQNVTAGAADELSKNDGELLENYPNGLLDYAQSRTSGAQIREDDLTDKSETDSVFARDTQDKSTAIDYIFESVTDSSKNENITENIDDYFTGTESASYIDKVCGSSDTLDTRSSFQIHNFTDDEEEAETVKPFYSDEEDDYSEKHAQNTSSNVASEDRNSYEQAGGADGRVHTAEAVSVSDYEPDMQEDDESTGLFKSYNVDISEVEEYDSGMSIAKKSGKSIMDMLEEASRTRKTNEDAKSAESPAEPDKKYKQQFESENDIVLNREYKNIIKQLLSGNENIFTDPAQAYAYNNQPAAASEFDSNSNAKVKTAAAEGGKQWRTEANFDKISDSVRNLGDDIKIRTYNSEADKEYTTMYYYLSNKLMLYQFGVMFILMMIEILAPFLIIKFGANISSAADIPILIISCLFAAIFPIYAVVQNFRNPNKRKRYNLDFKNSMLFRMLVLVLLLVIVYLVNIIFGMDVTNPIYHLIGLIIPALLATNFLVSLIIFRSMYNTQKFNTD